MTVVGRMEGRFSQEKDTKMLNLPVKNSLHVTRKCFFPTG